MRSYNFVNSNLPALGPDQILKVLTLTDSLNLHRESILIPLTTAEQGAVDLLPDGRLRITCPSVGSFDEWLNELRIRLQKMDLSKLGVH